MADWNDVRRVALSLPQTGEESSHGGRAWKVAGKLFVWERPLRASDIRQLAELGHELPAGEILGARVENELAKRVLIDNDPGVFFTTPHFNGYAAVLVRLDVIGPELLEETIVEAWLNRAPNKLVQQFLEQRGAGPAT